MANVYTLKFGTSGIDVLKNDTDPLLDKPGVELRLNIGPFIDPIPRGVFFSSEANNPWKTEPLTVLRLPWWCWWTLPVLWSMAGAAKGWPWWAWGALPLALCPWPFLTARTKTRGGYIGFKTSGFGDDWPWRRDTDKGYLLSLSARGASMAKEDARGDDDPVM